MMNILVWEWLHQVEGSVDITDIHCILACFYVDNALIVLRSPVVLQQVFNTLTGLFNHVELKMNTSKLEVIMFLPDKVRTCMVADSLDVCMDNLCSASRKGRKINYAVCGWRLTVGLLWSHLETRHNTLHSLRLWARTPPLLPPRRLTTVHEISNNKDL